MLCVKQKYHSSASKPPTLTVEQEYASGLSEKTFCRNQIFFEIVEIVEVEAVEGRLVEVKAGSKAAGSVMSGGSRQSPIHPKPLENRAVSSATYVLRHEFVETSASRCNVSILHQNEMLVTSTKSD